MDPIQYPKLDIGGQQCELKFRVGDIIRLKNVHNIDLNAAVTFQGVEAFERTMILLSVALSHAVKKSPEELADLIDLADFQMVAEAITEALKKASPQATKQQPTVQ